MSNTDDMDLFKMMDRLLKQGAREDRARTKKQGAVTWYGASPVTCNFCQQMPRKKFYDGKHQNGEWGVFCEDCWQSCGAGKLGLGFGQAYSVATRKLLKGSK